MDWSVAKVARLSEVETENCGIPRVKHDFEQLDRRGRVICGEHKCQWPMIYIAG